LLIQTVPASILAATSRAAERSEDQTEAAEPHVEAVCHGNSLANRAVADDRQGRAELLPGHQGVVVVDVGYESGRVEVTGLLGVRVSAEQDAGALAASTRLSTTSYCARILSR